MPVVDYLMYVGTTEICPVPERQALRVHFAGKLHRIGSSASRDAEDHQPLDLAVEAVAQLRRCPGT